MNTDFLYNAFRTTLVNKLKFKTKNVYLGFILDMFLLMFPKNPKRRVSINCARLGKRSDQTA